MNKFINYKLIILFMVVIFGISIADIAEADKAFSEIENRSLQQIPKFTKEKLLENEYTLQYEEYIDDQFFLRNLWIDIKSRVEFALGKIENNGIVYGKNDYMFEKYHKTNEERLQNNVEFIRKFIKNYSGNVAVGIIPSSYMKHTDYLPLGLQNLDQYSYIDKINEEFRNTLTGSGDLMDVFSLKNTDIEYYKTDHHWTTLGAYKAYAEMMEMLGESYVPLERGILGDDQRGTLGLIDLNDFYGTYYNKTKAFNAVPDILRYFEIPITDMTIDGKTVDSLYDLKRLNDRDKYSMFLYGNNGVTVIQSDNKIEKKPLDLTSEGEVLEAPAGDTFGEGIIEEEHANKTRVLLIKDSYGNCFAPYLTYSYDEVVVVDLRSLNKKMSEFIKEKNYDQVIILYSFMNLAQDVNIAKISY